MSRHGKRRRVSTKSDAAPLVDVSQKPTSDNLSRPRAQLAAQTPQDSERGYARRGAPRVQPPDRTADQVTNAPSSVASAPSDSTAGRRSESNRNQTTAPSLSPPSGHASAARTEAVRHERQLSGATPQPSQCAPPWPERRGVADELTLTPSCHPQRAGSSDKRR